MNEINIEISKNLLFLNVKSYSKPIHFENKQFISEIL